MKIIKKAFKVDSVEEFDELINCIEASMTKVEEEMILEEELGDQQEEEQEKEADQQPEEEEEEDEFMKEQDQAKD